MTPVVPVEMGSLRRPKRKRTPVSRHGSKYLRSVSFRMKRFAEDQSTGAQAIMVQEVLVIWKGGRSCGSRLGQVAVSNKACEVPSLRQAGSLQLHLTLATESYRRPTLQRSIPAGATSRARDRDRRVHCRNRWMGEVWK